MAAGGLGVTGGTAVLAGVFGSAGVALSARAIHIRTAGISEFAFDSLGGTGLLNIIAISGWLSQRDDFRKHWAPLTDLAPMANRYALRWESKHLLKLGTAIGVTCTAQASCQAAAFWAKQATRFAGRRLLWPAIVVEAINFIDNPWHVAADRAEKTGIELAEQLVERSLGRLPGILIGFSLGGRVIMSCLRHLAAGNHAGIVSDVVLMGAAVSPCENEWKDAQSVGTGRLVNAYCNTDWILEFLYRAAEFKMHAAGLGPVNIPGVVNVDISQIVNGHLAYADKLYEVLKLIGLDVGKPKYLQSGARDQMMEVPASSGLAVSCLTHSFPS